MFAEIHSSVRSIDILGQILSNRVGSFDKAQLRAIADEAIGVGLRVLKFHLELTAENKDGLVDMIKDLISQAPKGSNAEIAAEARSIYLIGCYWTSIALIERIAHAVGFNSLMPLFDELAKDNDGSVAFSLIYISVCMRATKTIPKDKIKRLYDRLDNDPLGRRMLRQIVLRHLYLNQVDFHDKQWLAASIELPLRQQLLIEKGK